MRAADSATTMPTLSPKAGTCTDLAALDAFLKPAEAHVYDPDKFLAAADALMAAGKNYDATVLLAKHRREDHCSPAVSDRLNSLADRMKGAPIARADLLTAFVNCSTGAQPSALAKALSSLDDELVEVGDPQRTASLALFAAGAGIKLGTWEPLEAIALKPGFVDRWQSSYPQAIGAALVLDHAATVLHGDPVRIEATQAQYDLVCGGMPASDRIVICKTLDSLRKKGKPDDASKKGAQEALASLLGPQR
jgi:hypothetical protein